MEVLAGGSVLVAELAVAIAIDGYALLSAASI